MICKPVPLSVMNSMSTILLASYMCAAILYKKQQFKTPFLDSLSNEQLAIKAESSKVRGDFFKKTAGLSVLALTTVWWLSSWTMF